MKIPYAKKRDTGEIVGIEDVESGIKCRCICPSCAAILIAKKGEINEHHFSHYKESSSICKYSYWESVRAMAEQIIELYGVNIQKKEIEERVDTLLSGKNQVIELNIDKKGMHFDAVARYGKVEIHIFLKTKEKRRMLPAYKKNGVAWENHKNIYIYEIDLSPIEDMSSTEGEEFLKKIFSTAGTGEWFSWKDEARRKSESQKIAKQIKKERENRQKEIIEKRNREISIQRELDLEQRKEREKKKAMSTDEKFLSRMIGFYSYTRESFSYKERLSEDLSVVYKGRNLWFVSCFNKFYAVAFAGTYIVYKVEKEEIIPLADAMEFENIPKAIKAAGI